MIATLVPLTAEEAVTTVIAAPVTILTIFLTVAARTLKIAATVIAMVLTMETTLATLEVIERKSQPKRKKPKELGPKNQPIRPQRLAVGRAPASSNKQSAATQNPKPPHPRTRTRSTSPVTKRTSPPFSFFPSSPLSPSFLPL